jgi:hypothetical protein
MLENQVFISHSSRDVDFVLQLNEFLSGLGIPKENIFCSSIEGQGVTQGNRIEDSVKQHLSNSTIIIYVLSQNFLKSQACMQELGVGWMSNDTKKCFFMKLDDISMEDIKGFLNMSYKFTFVNEESLSEFVDDFCDITNLPNLKASVLMKLIRSLINTSSSFIEEIVEEKKLSDKEIEQKVLEKLKEQMYKLNVGELKVLASIYFAEDQCGEFEVNSGVINLLQDKTIVYRLSQLSTFGMYFQFTLQPWAKDFITNDEKFRENLKKYYNGPSRNPLSYMNRF